MSSFWKLAVVEQLRTGARKASVGATHLSVRGFWFIENVIASVLGQKPADFAYRYFYLAVFGDAKYLNESLHTCEDEWESPMDARGLTDRNTKRFLLNIQAPLSQRGHGYYAVEASPLPVAFSISILFAGACLVSAIRLETADYVAFFHGATILVVVSVVHAWLMEVVTEVRWGHHSTRMLAAFRAGFLYFITSEAMLFGSFFAAFLSTGAATTSSTHGSFVPRGVSPFFYWRIPLVNTLLLWTSGYSLTLATARYIQTAANNRARSTFLGTYAILSTHYTRGSSRLISIPSSYPWTMSQVLSLETYAERFVNARRTASLYSRRTRAAVGKRAIVSPVDLLGYCSKKGMRRRDYFAYFTYYALKKAATCATSAWSTDISHTQAKNAVIVGPEMTFLCPAEYSIYNYDFWAVDPSIQEGFSGERITNIDVFFAHQICDYQSVEPTETPLYLGGVLCPSLWAWDMVVRGSVFLFFQAYEYSTSLFTISDSVYGGAFFALTGLHGIHVLLGVIFMAAFVFDYDDRANFKEDSLVLFSRGVFHRVGWECAAWYWHFVDVVWLYVFIIVYVWGFPTTYDLAYVV